MGRDGRPRDAEPVVGAACIVEEPEIVDPARRIGGGRSGMLVTNGMSGVGGEEQVPASAVLEYAGRLGEAEEMRGIRVPQRLHVLPGREPGVVPRNPGDELRDVGLRRGPEIHEPAPGRVGIGHDERIAELTALPL